MIFHALLLGLTLSLILAMSCTIVSVLEGATK